MTPPFTGFPPEAETFFRDLARNQDRDWVGARKALYEDAVKTPFAALLADLSVRLAQQKVPLQADPRALFRLNRDVRFSADKSPYKTHASAAITRDGTKQSPGVLYIHIDPEGSFAAAGFFRPEPSVLQALRNGMADSPKRWLALERALEANGLPLTRDDALVRAPRGFEAADAALADALRLKSWVVRRDLPPERVRAAGLLDDLADLAKRATPLLRFGWAALDPM